jgi:hypothetical protein
MCFVVGFDVYFANKLVIVAISGHVDIDSQLRLPINVCILCCRLRCVVGSELHVVGMESIGYPDLYGMMDRHNFQDDKLYVNRVIKFVNVEVHIITV